MGTLNPDLLSKDLDAVMNDAVALKDTYRKPTLMPEIILLALLRKPLLIQQRRCSLRRIRIMWLRFTRSKTPMERRPCVIP